MSSGQIENKLLDAIETVVNSAVARAGYDRTVQATIVRCENEAIGKYTVKYQDSLMYAYSSNLDTSYSNGTSVYVLIPSNDTGANKQIIGSVKKLGTDYLDNNEQNAYEYIGKNCIESDKEFGLCSYKPGQIITLYDKEANINEIDLNITDTELYLKNSNYLICGGNVRTNLNMEQQYAGNFGMIFELIFADNATGENIKRTYLLDVDAMHGNPYQLAAGVKQSNIFQIDGVNFKYVDKIYIFEKGFPNIATNKPEDIFFSNLELYGASLAPKDEDANCSLTVLTPQGIYFDNTYLETDSITLQAQIRVRGNVVDSKSDTLQYYWFRENNSITYTSEKYLKIGGAGWEFIDDSRNYQYTITKQDVPAKITKFKCVVVYNINTIVSKEVAIYNYSSPYEITIDSSKGTQFYYDLGETTLTCLINGEEQTSEDYTYVWSVVNNNGAFTSLTDGMEDYDIDKNKINNLSINTITNFSNFKCTAFYKNVNIGVGTIAIKNDLDGGATYSLVIDNGDQVFKYNEQGISPANQSLDNPIEILPLSFTLYDNTGEEIPHSAIKSEDIKWKVPNNNSMITIVNGTTPIETEYYDIYNGHEISFKIDPKYNVRKLNNTIILEVSYKDNLFISKTNLSFLKEGDIGTNGTDFICKIIPNLAYGNAPEHPMVILDKTTGSYRLNYIPKTEKKWFKVQLWHDGENIFESTETGYSTESTEDIVSVSWGILKNKYDKTISDNSNFAINSENGEITFDISDFTSDENTPANIVKCSVVYKGITYYATMPIIIARIKDSSYYVNLKDNSGFAYGIYTTDGRNPQYDNTRPFEIELFQNDSDISQADILSYNWNVLGSIYVSEWQSIQNLIAQKRLDLQKNQHVYRPIDENNGYCLSNAIYCSISNSTEEIASIHIPVHLFLNRYGNASMNGWDGNSININEDNGVILAPQVGAGQKEKDNSFTGVFMGSVSEAGSNEIETGLFGYSSGVRTIELNSKDGSAKFGKQGQSQIILDPNNDTATLKSGNYVAPVLDKDGNVITPGSGLEIDLTDPHITFGTGNFRVDSNGNAYAKGFATVKELNNGTIQLPTKAVDGLDSKLAGLEESIKYLDISMPTSIIAFTTDKDNKPLKTETETINYKATFKGQPIAARAVTTDTIENLSITTSIDETSKLGTITFEVTKDKTIINNKNVVTFTFSCIVDEITYTVQKEVSIILNVIGENGRSIESITEMYYSSANSTSLIDGSWSADYPGWVSGRYIWTKSVVKYSDGTTTETDPMCVSGENGKGISASAVEYQISTSGTDVPTGTWSSTLLTPSEGEYLWTRTTITYTTGDPSVSYSVSYHGTSGSDGKGISKTEIDYQISTSGSDIPTGEWSKTIPTLEEDKFLWTRTTIIYTDNTTSVSYSISRSGSTGNDGVGITKVDVEYYLSTSSSAPVGGEWSTTAPAWENGKYMWSRTKVYYTEGQPTTSEEVCISGARGTDGTSVTILGSYDDLEELIREHPTGNPGDSYIVWKHLFIWAVNTSEWKDVGQIEGNDGTNGETSYLHIKYSNDGGKTFTGHEGEDPGDYLGQYVDFTKEDSKDVTKYTWKLIKGTDGKNGIGISNVVEYYLVSPNKEGVTTETTGWGTAIPTMTKDNKYLWNYEEVIYTSGPSKTTTPKVIGMYGEEGKGVSSIVNYYLATNSSSGVTTTTSGWTETMQTATKDKKYLWNYEVVNYTDNTNYTSTPAIIGTYAENGISYYTHIRYSANADGTDYVQKPTTATKYIGIATTTSATAPTNKGSYTWSKYSGDDGKGVSTTTIEYKVSNNGSTPPTGTWSTTIPSITAGQYLWTRTTVNYTSGDPSISYTVSYQGIDGDSITIVEKSVTYQASNSGTEEPQGSWSTTIPVVGPGKYLWTKSYVKYSDDTENTTYSVSYQGANGTSVSITSQKVEYAQGSSGITKPTTGWQESIPAVPDGKYLWTRTTVNYSNSTKTESYSVSYQSKDGTSATQYYTYIKYADDASGTNMTDASTGKKFIGVAVSTSITAPTTASSYTWTKFVGDDATQYYTYIRYSAVSTGANMVETPTTSTKYIGTYVGTSATVPAYTSFKWSKYQGTDGTSPINIVCGNENQTIPCLSDGKVTAAMTIIIPFAGYEGSTRKACTVTYSTLPSGITLKSNTAATASADGSLQFSVAKDATLGGSDTGTITLTFTCSSKTFTKTFVWSKAKAGLNGGKGDQGVSVTKVDEIYFLSSSNITAPTLPTTHVTSTSTDSGVWTTVCPKWKQNYFYWTSSEIAYSDGHYTWSKAVLNSGLNSALNDANSALSNSNTALDRTIVEKEITDYPIHIEDAGEINALKCIVYGNSEQKTSVQQDGDNIFDFQQWYKKISNGIMTPTYNRGTFTLNENGFSVGQPSGKDCWMIASGMVDGVSTQWGYTGKPDTEARKTVASYYTIPAEASATYTLSCDITFEKALSGEELKSELYIFAYDTDFNYLGLVSKGIYDTFEANVSKRVFINRTLPQNTKYIFWRVDNESYYTSTPCKMTVSNIAIKKGTNSTYTPFVPNSPSPDYPSEIKSIPSIRNLFDKDTWELGYINASGVLTSQNIQATFDYRRVKPNTTYTIHLSKQITSINYAEYSNNKIFIKRSINDFKQQLIFTTSSTTEYIRIWFKYDDSTIITQEIIDNLKPMLEEGTIAHPYVPYGSWLKVKDTGKNLNKYPYKDTTVTRSGITYNDNGDGTINVNGTATATAYFNMTTNNSDEPIKLKAGTYTASLGAKSNVRATIANYYNNKQVVAYILASSDKTTFTINEDMNLTFVLAVNSGLSVNNILIKPQLEEVKEGQTEPTEYEPYQEKEVLIDLNKPNLFDKNNYINGIWYDGTLKKFTSNSTTYSLNANVKPNTTYTINTKNKGNRFVIVGSSNIPKAGDTLNSVIYAPSTIPNNYTFTTGTNDNYIFFGFYVGTDVNVVEEVLEDIQIYEGYKPYYEISSINDTKDTLDIVNGQVVIDKKIEEVVLDGSETGLRLTDSDTTRRRFDYKHGLLNIDSNYYHRMNTHFIYPGYTSNTGIWGEYYMSETWLVFNDNDSKMADLETFKTWLQEQYNNGTPVTIKYVLAKSKQITLPNTQIPLFEGINHIYIESNLEPSNIYLKYYTNSDINNSVKEANKNFAQKSKTTAYYTTTITPDLPGKDVEWLDNVTSSTELYIWQKFITTYDNGADPIETTPSCIYTPAAKIHDTKTQYCIHTSNTVAPNNATALWENNRPEWKKEYCQEGTKRYLWVRTIYEYINPAKIEYSTASYDPSWEDLGWLDAAIDESAEKINGAINNGSVKIHDGVIEVIKDPTNAIMFSSAGISFKLNGEYTSVWDIDGTFNAQLIQVKQLNANSILSGTLTLKAASDDTNGRFILQNRNGKEVALIDVNGLTVTATDGSKIQLKTNEDGTGKGLYLYDAFGHEFVHTNTSQGILEVTKQKITEYQDFSTNIRIITVTDGIGFVGI